NSFEGRPDGTPAMPTIVFHGDQDQTVHPKNAARVIARATGDTRYQTSTQHLKTVSGESYSRSVLRDGDGRSVLELWELHAAGHAWPGRSAAGSFTTSAGPDATAEMLRFFLEHRRL